VDNRGVYRISIDAAIGFYKFSDMMGKILIAAFDNAVHAT